ncbi:hypothetical protein ACI784_09250 [Geodermatophilus sp. SYSU D01186]
MSAVAGAPGEWRADHPVAALAAAIGAAAVTRREQRPPSAQRSYQASTSLPGAS